MCSRNVTGRRADAAHICGVRIWLKMSRCTGSIPRAHPAQEKLNIHSHPEVRRDPGHRHPVDHHRLDRHHHRVPRQLAALRHGRAQVMTPGPLAPGAPVTRDQHPQQGRFPAERHMRHAPHHRVVPRPRVTTTRAGRRRGGRDTRQHRVVGFDPLGGHGQTETIQTAELIKTGWSNVSHKGPWVCGSGVRYLHPANPRAPTSLTTRPQQQGAVSSHVHPQPTLFCEEPLKRSNSGYTAMEPTATPS